LSVRAIRGRLLTFLRAPRGSGDAQCYRYIEDGIVLVKDGRIEAVGPVAEMTARAPAGTPLEHHAGALIVPGFIDPHIHYPQTQVIASYGAQLLEWLEKYTFVEEQKFADRRIPRATPNSFSTSWRVTAPPQRSPIAPPIRLRRKRCLLLRRSGKPA